MTVNICRVNIVIVNFQTKKKTIVLIKYVSQVLQRVACVNDINS